MWKKLQIVLLSIAREAAKAAVDAALDEAFASVREKMESWDEPRQEAGEAALMVLDQLIEEELTKRL